MPNNKKSERGVISVRKRKKEKYKDEEGMEIFKIKINSDQWDRILEINKLNSKF